MQDLEPQNRETGKLVQRIMEEKRLVFYGLSTKPNDFSHGVYKELAKRDFDIHAINPKGGQVQGVKLHHPLDPIPDRFDTAYILVNSVYVEEIVQHCHEQGITKFWLHRGTGEGAVSPEALAYCEAHDLEVIAGHCPLMFLEGTGIIHRIHRWFRKRDDCFPIID